MELVFAQFRLHNRLYHNVLSGFTEENSILQTGEENPVKWIAGHLVNSRSYIAKQLGAEVEQPFPELFGKGATPPPFSEWPSLDALMANWNPIAEILLPAMENASPEQLAAPVKFPFPLDNGKLSGHLAFFAHHEAFHIGQIALQRRMVGLDPMKYG